MPTELKPKKTLLDGQQMRRIVRRMANELIELNRGVEDLVLIGIRTRGVPLAEAIAAEIESVEGRKIPIGILDITLYRDDLSTIAPQPVVKETRLPGTVDGQTLVLCDDVLYTGRTIRAALDALIDYGRPRAVQLAVLIDRGYRELPIQADVVGKRLEVAPGEVVEVRFEETDGVEQAMIMEQVKS